MGSNQLDAALNVRLTSKLLDRVKTCATEDGARLPDFVRLALIERCERSERQTAHRERTARIRGERSPRIRDWRPEQLAIG